jgi:lysyl-tRNA synthetase, class II
VLRRAAGLPALVAAVFCATGWLYLVQPRVPGPRVSDALPLDELPKHAAIPLLWFLVVWSAVGLALGLYARWARIERLTAALVLGLAIGALSYVQVGLSLAVVRQISLRAALDVAARRQAVYLPAVLVALAAAALATPRRGGRRGAAFVAAVVACGALLNLLHAVLPGDDASLLHSFTPDAVGPLSEALGVFAAIAMLVAARGLTRRRRRAWQVATAVAVLSTTVHVLHGLNHGTLASTVVLALLVARRSEFDGPGDATTRNLFARRAIVSLAAISAYALAALWINRFAADQSFTPHFVVAETLDGIFGRDVHGSTHLAGAFGQWFPLSLLLLGIGFTAWAVAGWLAPWRHRVAQAEHECEVARELVQEWGSDTLAPFVLRADKSYFFTEDESAFLAFRVVRGVAIVSGDPVGPPDKHAELVGRFVERARACDWRIAILGASSRCLPLYRAHGLQALYHGDEAIVDVESFSLEGRAIRKVRQSVHRLVQAEYVVRALRPSEIDAQLRDELEELARAWRGDQPERGFVMALDELFSLDDKHALFVVGFDPSGAAAGFLHFALTSAPPRSLSLSSMPRLRTTPNGFNEWLICAAVEWARAHDYVRISLNFSPFAAILAPDAELTGAQELQRRALLVLKGHFQLDNLLSFNRKFFPQWERRFVVYERRRDLPRIGIAALAAEAYLPFVGERR